MRISCVVLLLVMLASRAVACNVPVFRYALERWRPDSSEILVFYENTLLPEQEQIVARLESESMAAGGPANSQVRRVQLDKPGIDKEWTDVLSFLGEQKKVSLPYLVVRTKLGRDRVANCWHGRLEDASQAGLCDSPVRRELCRRLLSGDSVVWLLLKSADAKRTQTAKALLTGQFAKMSATLSLPDGIGLPGSELHSEVPLLLKFSVLELDPGDKRETFLVKMLSAVHAQAYAEGEPMLIPVFGRGRALEVIPASQLDADLIQNLTMFLCGACSCQVKEKNPGFDLLLSFDWNTQLFGVDAQPPPPSESLSEGKSQVPVQLTIPPGRKSR